jgi:hypothetical protein
MTGDTRPQPNSGTMKHDKAERSESNKRLENKHDCPESKNGR